MKYIFVLLSLLVITACSESGEIDDIIISKEKIQGTVSTLTVDVSSMDFESSGGSKELRITSNTKWSITKPEWCSLSSTTGSDNAVIVVTAEENTQPEQRTGSIVITGVGVNPVTVQIRQSGKKNEQTTPGADDNTPPTI